jgi:hypothetical protein
VAWQRDDGSRSGKEDPLVRSALSSYLSIFSFILWLITEKLMGNAFHVLLIVSRGYKEICSTLRMDLWVGQSGMIKYKCENEEFYFFCPTHNSYTVFTSTQIQHI